jgi:hypothetical protein
VAAFTFPGGWFKGLTTVVAHLPLLLAVVLSAPVLIIGPFLPTAWSTRGNTRLQQLRGWHREILERLPRP